MAVRGRNRFTLVLSCIALILPSPNSGVARAPAQNLDEMPLTVSQVVDKLVEKNAERADALEHYQGRRLYRLDYVGFPGDMHAEMIVDVSYNAPATKEFKVVSQSGSKWIINRIFRRLLDSEREALQEENQKHTALNRGNYDFTMREPQVAHAGCSYVLSVQPKIPNKFLYRGQIWVDTQDFAVCRIEAEPAKNPSFWIKKTEIHHAYLKVGEFWLPAENKTVSTLRLGGRATLTIKYQNYDIQTARAPKESDIGLASLVPAVPKRTN